MKSPPTLTDIKTAANRIQSFIHRTPILTCKNIDDLFAANIFFKCENFQKIGAFKFRGACNAVLSLSEADAKRGVATHSSGNHAAALSLAAQVRKIDAHIVMPKNAPEVKKRAVAGYGGKIIFCEPTLESREKTLARVVQNTGTVEIHSYNDYRIIAGQGTAALELLEDIPNLDIILAPVGGGGLLSGTSIVTTEISPTTKVIAAEPEKADDAFRSFYSGQIFPSINPQTIADGLLTSLGELTFSIIRDHVTDIVTVSEEGIIRAMKLIWERMKIIIEPSAAVPVAALLEQKLDSTGKQIGIILSGGNVDLERLPW